MPLFTFAHYVGAERYALYAARLRYHARSKKDYTSALLHTKIARVIAQPRRLCALKSSRYFSHHPLIA